MARRRKRAVAFAFASLLLLATGVDRGQWQFRPSGPAFASVQSSNKLSSISVGIIGAGPSGLLLAHRLLDAGARVELFEARADPREEELEGRAYALGLGIRGRTAIRSVDDKLWESIKPNGFGSERFKLHFSSSFALDLRTPEDGKGLEPSLLVYQSDLCGAMLEELEARHMSSGRLRVNFGARVLSVDPSSQRLVVELPGEGGEPRTLNAEVDLIAGCDGVNSVVRQAVAEACPGFKVDRVDLPGVLKVLRLARMPKALDPTAVHAIPGGGGSAFVEPTAEGVCVLVNWRTATGNKDQADKAKVDLGGITDAKVAQETLAKMYPLLADEIDDESGRAFVKQSPTSASTIRCNTYHCGSAVLLGDAAHSTGGASGQGCNSALQDSVALVDCLEAAGGDVPAALLAYSLRRVPEGHALLDLSVGPGPNVNPVQRALFAAAGARDTLLYRFGLGDPPLQTELTTTLTPFAEIRRRKDFFYGDFPSATDYDASIRALDEAAKSGASEAAR